MTQTSRDVEDFLIYTHRACTQKVILLFILCLSLESLLSMYFINPVHHRYRLFDNCQTLDMECELNQIANFISNKFNWHNRVIGPSGLIATGTFNETHMYKINQMVL